MRVLVTGATGFTGGHLCRRLRETGYGVRALARAPGKAGDLEKRGIEIMPGDLKDEGSLRRAVDDCDIVYHIAAAFRQEGIPDSEFREVNVAGTRRLLDAARNAGVRRFVHCSTVGVHGHIENPPADESAPFRPGDLYQETKLAGELLARDYFRQHRWPGVIFRPVGIYGPGDRRFLKLFRHIKSGKFHMIGSGKPLYHLTYIDDLVDGIILCGTKERAAGQTYILGGEGYMPLNELVTTIARVLGVSISPLRVPFWPVYSAAFICEKVFRPLGLEPPIYRRRVDFFKKDRAFDISKAKRELGFAPGVGPEEGLRKTAEWYLRNGLM